MKTAVSLFLILFLSQSIFAQFLENDRLALIDLYNATNGPNWINKTGWNVPGTPGDNPCSWYGVSCSGERVYSLNLSFNQLNGTIPASFGNLSELQFLSLNSNQLSGNIPASIENLLSLQFITLDNNQLSGSIPASIGNLSNLKVLNLSSNQLSGSIPFQIGNLTKLELIYLSSNQLSGNIPAQFGNLSNLKFLHLGGNQLNGNFNLSGIPASADVRIQNNKFTFDGIEPNISLLDYYSPQANLPLTNTAGVLSVNAGGTLANNTYRWYTKNTNTLVATNVGNANFTPNVAGSYYVQVSNSIATELTLIGDGITLSVPAFSSHPNSVTVCPGTSVSFTANATNAITYQWQVKTGVNEFVNLSNTGIYSNVTSTTLTISNAAGLNGYQYRCVATGTEGSANSNAAVLTVISTAVGTLEADRLALIDLYNSTNGPNWANKTGWNVTGSCGDNPCSWYGVSCAAGRVYSLNFTFNQLSGSIPASIGNLSNLQYLGLEHNQLSGNIPASIGNLSNLQYLALYYNQLSGSIPASIGNLSNLLGIGLYSNQLSGSIPSSIGNLSNLQFLYLENNQLSGSIPASIGNLSNLQFLDLANNQLSGSIPASIGNLKKLTKLYLDENQLSGTFNLNGISAGADVRIQNNKFIFDGIQSNISLLDSYSPQANLPITNTAGLLSVNAGGTLANNTYRWYRKNPNTLAATIVGNANYTPNVSGTYFVQINNSIAANLTLTSDDFTLTIADPPSFTTHPSSVTACSGNSASFSVSAINANTYQWQVKIGTNEFVNLNNNDVYANVTTSSLNISNVTGLTGYQYRCVATGIGGSVNSNAATLTVISTAIGTLEGDRLALIDFYNATNGPNWTNKMGWNVPGTCGDNPCSWYGVSCAGGRVAALQFFSNNLTGSLPNSLGNLDQLQYLEIFNNPLAGTIPTSIGNLTNLYYLNLGYNQLSGSIPDAITNLTLLNTLLLYNNKLNGNIPSSIGNLVNLNNLNLQSNQLIGSIPISIGNLINSTRLNLAENQLTGTIPTSLGNATQLVELILGNNQLSGTIPTSLGNLNNLQTLALFGNQLTGSIPSSIGNLLQLKELYLGNNLLTVTIPSEIGNLSNLVHLSLFSNQLTGSIPPSIGNLSNLKTLLLTSNRLTGTIPSTIWSLVNLEDIWIGYNQLSGTIPATIGNLTKLKSFLASSNQLTGNIPAEIGNLTNLSVLELHSNQLTGSIPSTLGNSPALYQVRLYNNQLSGSIPSNIKKLINLSSLWLYNNQLSGAFDLTGLPSTADIQIQNNKFTFNGIESNISLLDSYAPQANLAITNAAGVLSVNAGGTLSKNTYRWYRKNPTTLLATNVGNANYSPNTSGVYFVQVNNSAAPALTLTSDDFTLTIADSPSFTTQPKNVTACSGNSASFSVSAINANAYQWQVKIGTNEFVNLSNNGVYTNVTTNSLNISNVTGLNGYQYRCVATGTGGSANSNAATLTVISTAIGTLESDRLALIDLYNATNGPNWKNKTGWNVSGSCGDNPCSWFGVSCSGGRVIFLELYNNNLAGNIPNSIGNLTNLVSLWLNNNQLTGSIPSTIGTLTNLIFLELNDNQLTSSIPATIGTLTNLTSLSVQNNHLVGSIPNTLGSASKLKYMWAYNNQLTGEIPAEIGNLTGLEIINLYSNKLNGSIPGSIGNLNKLKTLWLSENQLTGNIPNSIGNLNQLTDFYLDGNQLTGNFNLSGIPLSTNVRIQNNKFTFNSIESNISLLDSYAPQANLPITNTAGVLSVNAGGTLANNTYRWYRKNPNTLAATIVGNANYTPNVSGTYFVQVNNSIAANLTLTSDDFTLTIADPPSFTTHPSIVTACSGNSASFSVSAINANAYQWQVKIGTNEFVNLNNNDVYANVTTSSLNISNVTGLTGYQYRCVATGTGGSANSNAATLSETPTGIGTLEGDRLALIDLYNATNGPNWINKTGWNVSGSCGDNPCSWFGVSCSGGRVIFLDLPNNNLAGNIPNSIGNLTNLVSIGLNNNQLTGSIPSTIGNLTNLVTLYLDRNQLNGSIPAAISNLTRLERLQLGVNKLSGTIPTVIGNLTQLRSLGLYNNQLTGSIPTEIGNLIWLEVIFLNNNGFTDIPNSIVNLTQLNSLDLSGNQLTGSVPAFIMNLVNLKYLGLGANQLTGSIPASINNLRNLTLLNLGDNGLTGTIPTELGNLTDLAIIHLENNQLTGNIPSSIWNLTHLVELNLHSNKLTGSISESIGNLTKLWILKLNSNQLTDGIPASIGNLTNLIVLYLDNNKLTGSIPNTISNLTQLNELNLNNNHLTGNFNLSGIPASADVQIKSNKFTFDGIESNTALLDNYAPQANLVITNATGVLSVNAGGTLSKNTYRWYKKNPTTLLTTNVGNANYSPNTSGVYFVQVNNSAAPALTLTGDDFTFTIADSPSFSTHPSSLTACSGNSASFTVSAINANAYQWQVKIGTNEFVNLSNGGVYANVTTNSLNISNVTGLNGYQYRCVATGTGGSANSNAATLTIGTTTSVITLQSPEDDISTSLPNKNAIKINATNKILSSGQVVYQGGQSVQLNPGFTAQSGSIFTAQIRGCN